MTCKDIGLEQITFNTLMFDNSQNGEVEGGVRQMSQGGKQGAVKV